MAKHTAVIDRVHPAGMGGSQRIFRFENGYGASVVRFPGSYGHEQGLFELAVVKFDGDANDRFSISYDTPITNDVLGHLSSEAVDAALDQIAALPA